MANIGRKATKCTTFLPATKNWLTNTLSPIYWLTLICIGTHCDTSTTCHFRHMMSLICTLQRSSHNDLDGCQRDVHFGPLVLHSWAHPQIIDFFPCCYRLIRTLCRTPALFIQNANRKTWNANQFEGFRVLYNPLQISEVPLPVPATLLLCSWHVAISSSS